MRVTSLLYSYYSSSDQYLLENMALYVNDWSHVAEICSYRTHTLTVIHTVRPAICSDIAAQEDSPLPLMVLSSCYLCLASLFWKFRIRLRRLTWFSLFPTMSFSGLIRISINDTLQIPCWCSQLCNGSNAATRTPMARVRLYLCTCSGDGIFGTQYEKSAEHDPHLHFIVIPPRKALFPTLQFLSKLLAQPPNALLIRRSHSIFTSKFSLTPELHVEVCLKNYRLYLFHVNIYVHLINFTVSNQEKIQNK